MDDQPTVGVLDTTRPLHRRISAACNALPFVTWDRFVTGTLDGHSYVEIYGWINRADGQRDFVLIVSWTHWDSVEYVTSSAKFSAEIGRILYGDKSDHNDCIRAADVFALDQTVERSQELKEEGGR